QGAEMPHGTGIPQIGCLCVPASRDTIILRKARSCFAQFAQTSHGAGETLLGCVAVPVHRTSEISGLPELVGERVHRRRIAQDGRLLVPAPRVPEILRYSRPVLAELSQMGHCPGMTQAGGALVPFDCSR